jgi:hypothetical protein
MHKILWVAVLGLAEGWAFTPAARAQARPYIGYVYPAGGQQGTTFQARLGGQGLDDVNEVWVSGEGVTAKVVDYFRRLSPQEIQLLNEQLKELKRATSSVASAMTPMMAAENPMMMSAMAAEKTADGPGKTGAAQNLTARIQTRIREYVQTPACASIANLIIAEVTVAPDARPGARELRLAGPRGVSNPLVFHVGALPEVTRKPMTTANLQVLGKEELALRKRPTNEVEVRITLPCTMYGQIASGEVNRYRFSARKGQRLVVSTLGRQLVPYIADAVPGWFQPELALYDAKGKEVAFDDDYRFNPDPVMLYEVAKDGEFVLAINDAIYRGREDFVYRISIGELPWVTSIFPLGAKAGTSATPKMKGWNLQGAELSPPRKDAEPGVQLLTAIKKEQVSNPVRFALDKLPDAFDQEPNNTITNAQKVTLPVIINGRIDRTDDWDVFQFTGKSNDTIVAEVQARRLDSPLDSVIKLTDATGKLLAFNDDREDLGAGVNTHHADSWFMARLPADGKYFVHLGDTARKGGDEYGYRLRLSAAMPDFALRVVPSSVAFRSNSTAAVTIYAARKDGFAGPIKLALKEPPPGFSAPPVTLLGTQIMTRLTIKADLVATEKPVKLLIAGTAKLGEKEIIHEAVPAEDRMQAFLWRHLVPASDLLAQVYDPGYSLPPKHPAPVLPPSLVTTNVVKVTNVVAATNIVAGTNAATGTNPVAAAKPKFTKQQIVGRLRQLKLLYEEGLFTDDFYREKVVECDVAP